MREFADTTTLSVTDHFLSRERRQKGSEDRDKNSVREQDHVGNEGDTYLGWCCTEEIETTGTKSVGGTLLVTGYGEAKMDRHDDIIVGEGFLP
jgi:hypothetical protein